MKNPQIEPPPETGLEQRTNQFLENVQTHATKLNAIRLRSRRTKQDMQSQLNCFSAIAEVLAQSTGLETVARTLIGEWEQVVSVSFMKLDSQIREMCIKRSWRLDGQWPDFMVDFGIPVHVDEDQRAIEVGGEKRVPIADLEQTLLKITADLVPENFSVGSFLAKLAAGYDSVASTESVQVPILDVYRQLVIQSQSSRFWRDADTSSFTPLTIHQFRARVSRILQEGVTATTDGRELRLFPPLNPKDAVFVYQPAERRFGYVGRIEFRTP